MQLNSRDDAEASAANIDVSGLSKHLQRQTVRAAADFYQLTGKGFDIQTIRLESDRSYALDTDKSIGLEDLNPKARRRILFHEMGHHAEFNDPESTKLASDWVRERASGEPESLSKMTGLRYGDNEVAFPDRFISPYVGKHYDDGFTEVHSMGLENFADGHALTEFFKKDPDHFDLMIRYIRQ
jgi:hypothetical protein